MERMFITVCAPTVWQDPGDAQRTVHAKCACLGLSLQKASLTLGVQVVITDLEKLDQLRQRKSDVTRSKSRSWQLVPTFLPPWWDGR